MPITVKLSPPDPLHGSVFTTFAISSTVAPASAVPVNTGVDALVRLSPDDEPVSELHARSGTAIGAAVSTVRVRFAEKRTLLPAAWTLSTCSPSVKDCPQADAQVQSPQPSPVVVARSTHA